METKLPGKHFRKFGYTSQGCPVFDFFLLLEVAENSNRTFWLNGTGPLSHSPACVSDRGRLGYTSPVFLCVYNPRWRRVKAR